MVQGYEDVVEYLASKKAPLELKDKVGTTGSCTGWPMAVEVCGMALGVVL